MFSARKGDLDYCWSTNMYCFLGISTMYEHLQIQCSEIIDVSFVSRFVMWILRSCCYHYDAMVPVATNSSAFIFSSCLSTADCTGTTTKAYALPRFPQLAVPATRSSESQCVLVPVQAEQSTVRWHIRAWQTQTNSGPEYPESCNINLLMIKFDNSEKIGLSDLLFKNIRF
jgi:hypothetical protein